MVWEWSNFIFQMTCGLFVKKKLFNILKSSDSNLYTTICLPKIIDEITKKKKNQRKNYPTKSHPNHNLSYGNANSRLF